MDNWDLLKRFLQNEKARYKERKCLTALPAVLSILEGERGVLKASMVFAIEHTDTPCNLINETQKVNEPTVINLALKLASTHKDLKSVIATKKFHPRVETALESVPVNNRTALRATFLEEEEEYEI